MGDAGEGLIDQDARIQERMEELERERTIKKGPDKRDPARVRAIESLTSLKLFRAELQRQHEATSHEARRAQLTQALHELDQRMAELNSVVNG